MGKPEWGNKCECRECGTRFYDLGRTPAVCPRCETVFQPLKTAKPAPAAPRAVAEPAAKAATAEAGPVDAKAKDGTEPAVIEGDAEEDDLFEDVVDEDEDVAEVIDTKVANESEV